MKIIKINIFHELRPIALWLKFSFRVSRTVINFILFLMIRNIIVIVIVGSRLDRRHGGCENARLGAGVMIICKVERILSVSDTREIGLRKKLSLEIDVWWKDDDG
jgi:hypothetical protein